MHNQAIKDFLQKASLAEVKQAIDTMFVESLLSEHLNTSEKRELKFHKDNLIDLLNQLTKKPQ